MSSASIGALLTAFQHADSQFPSGGFAFSQGLEAWSNHPDRLGELDLATFLDVQIRRRWAGSDRVALVRAHRLRGDLRRLAELDVEVEASTIPAGLRAGSRRNGNALLTAHSRIQTPGAREYRSVVQRGDAPGHLAVVQGLVWQALGVEEGVAVAISGYQAAASLTTAAVRLGLVGAIEAQMRLREALVAIDESTAQLVADGESLRSFAPLSDIAVTMHGSDGQRLFSN